MKIIKLIWIVSMAAVMGVLLYEHVVLQAPVMLKIDQVGQYDLSKDEFFYLVLATIVVFNGILLTLGTLIPQLPKQFLVFPQRTFWTSTKQTRLIFLQNFKLWTKGLATIINLFLIVYLLAVQLWNQPEPPFAIDTMLATQIVIGLLMAWLVVFFAWFGYIKNAAEKLSVKSQAY